MNIRTTCILLLLLIHTASLAQLIKIEGTVINSDNQAAVPFASAGIAGKAIGSVANEQGYFYFMADQSQLKASEKVVISCIGFASVEIPLEEFYRRGRLDIPLQPQVITLPETVVQKNKFRPRVLGHNSRSLFSFMNFYSRKDTTAHDRLGREIGCIVRVKGNCMLDDFNFFAGMNEFSQIKFRLNIYQLDAQGLPDTSLLQQDIIVEINGQSNQWVKVDLKKYRIFLEQADKVAVCLQWLSSKGNNSRFFCIPATVSATHTMLTRDKSQSAWTKTGGNLSMYFNAACDRSEN